MTMALYAGSFDPITNGHMWMIEKGVELFDSLIIVVGNNPNKKYLFDQDRRRQIVIDTFSCRLPIDIRFLPEDQYLIDFARSLNII